MSDITRWGEIPFIVDTPGIVLEWQGKLPPGTFGRGYFNIHGDNNARNAAPPGTKAG